MAAKSDYVSGTISLTNGETAFTGTGTGWQLADFREGDTIIDITGATEYMGVIATIDGNGAGTLTKAWEGPTLVDVAYRMRYQPDGSRSSAQARNLIELLGNGNLQAMAGLEGSANQVLMFTGPGAMTTVSRTELISGAAYDVQVDDLTARAAYDGQDEGYSVLVADTGDGRSAIYSKNSATSADWSDPAYVTGGSIDVTVGDVAELAFGAAPTVQGTPGAGTLELDFGLPGGPALSVGTVTRGDADVTSSPVTGGYELSFVIPSQVAQGDYAGGTAYVAGDVVQDAGSSWVALQATTGNAPPTLPATSNTYWQLLARAGNDGAGTVTSLAAGDGISIDSTDPTVPVVSVDATPFALTLFDDADASTARGTLGADDATNLTSGTLPDARVSSTLSADKAFRRGNILGTVSQSGSVPTGAIIERGSNANGEYVRFADGTQICWADGPIDAIDSTGQMGSTNLHRSSANSWTFPAAFVAAPVIQGLAYASSNAGVLWIGLISSPSATSVSYFYISTVSGGSAYGFVSAIGRWF